MVKVRKIKAIPVCREWSVKQLVAHKTYALMMRLSICVLAFTRYQHIYIHIVHAHECTNDTCRYVRMCTFDILTLSLSHIHTRTYKHARTHAHTLTHTHTHTQISCIHKFMHVHMHTRYERMSSNESKYIHNTNKDTLYFMNSCRYPTVT